MSHPCDKIGGVIQANHWKKRLTATSPAVDPVAPAFGIVVTDRTDKPVSKTIPPGMDIETV